MHFLNQPIFRSGWTAWVHGHPCGCAARRLCVCLLLPQGAAAPGHGQDPPPCWAGTWLSRALLMPETLLARLGTRGFRPGASWSLQEHPGAPVLPRPVLPELHQGACGGCPREPGDTLPRSCAGPAGHHWHLGVPLCLPAASGEPQASPPAAACWGTGDICCFFTPRKHHLLGSLLSPRQAGGEPIAPVPLARPQQPPAGLGLPPSSCGHPQVA